MSDKILAQAPGDDCYRTVQHSGEPKGRVEKIGDIDTYIATPPTGTASIPAKGIILFYADVYGPLYINNKLLQDYFAEHGYIVLGIDYFLGDPVYVHLEEEGFDRSAWGAKSREQAREHVPTWLEAVRERFGKDAKYAAVGYCFGAPYVLETGAESEMTATAIAHPAYLTEAHFRDNNAPLFLSCAEIDQTFGLEFRRRAEDILIEGKKTYHFQVFSGIRHGFAIRGDPAVENERWAKEESARSIVGWFNRFIK